MDINIRKKTFHLFFMEQKEDQSDSDEDMGFGLFDGGVASVAAVAPKSASADLFDFVIPFPDEDDDDDEDKLGGYQGISVANESSNDIDFFGSVEGGLLFLFKPFRF